MILLIDNDLSIGFPISDFIDWSGWAYISPRTAKTRSGNEIKFLVWNSCMNEVNSFLYYDHMFTKSAAPSWYLVAFLGSKSIKIQG